MFSFENNKNKKQKMKFGKYKDRRTVRVRNHKDWKMYRSKEYGKFGNDYSLEIGLDFCG